MLCRLWAPREWGAEGREGKADGPAQIVILGPEYSRLSPRNYVIVFVVIDVLSLILQGVGGGMSGAAAGGAGVSLQTGR